MCIIYEHINKNSVCQTLIIFLYVDVNIFLNSKKAFARNTGTEAFKLVTILINRDA